MTRGSRKGLPTTAGIAIVTAALVAGGAVASCAAAQDGASRAVDVPAIELDPALADAAVSLTRDLIRSRSVNPPGDEINGARVMAEFLRAEGITVELKEFAGETRQNLKAVLPATETATGGAVVLLGHSDVVPADAAKWDADGQPFDASIVGDALVGRGAADMLGTSALQALTLVALQRAGGVRKRDVILLFVGDEEVDGLGVQAALEAWPDVARARWSITEGAFLIQDYYEPGRDLAPVSVAEKGIFQFELIATGHGGHGSVPRGDDDATNRLVRAVSRVLDRPEPFQLSPPTERMFAAVGSTKGAVSAFVSARPALLSMLGRGDIEASAETRSLVHDTCALTLLDAGLKRNVIPSHAHATFDCRILPGTDAGAFRDELLLLIDDPRVELKVLAASPANGSPHDDVLMDVIRTRIKRESPGTNVIPYLSRGATDNRFMRAAGVNAYGFVPYRLTLEELSTHHGPNERVRVEELKAGLSRFVDVVAALTNL